MMFVLHQRLAADTHLLGQMRLCLLLLMNDATYPWFILVPQRPQVGEIFELAAADRSLLIDEVTAVSQAVAEVFAADKLNIAALGNLVPQLHVHVIGRFRADPAWPAPIWGRSEPQAYRQDDADAVRRRMAGRLGTTLAAAG
jgi:diadenosine tetraphosphate (Ap4A) HIT family hydrolase